MYEDTGAMLPFHFCLYPSPSASTVILYTFYMPVSNLPHDLLLLQTIITHK